VQSLLALWLFERFDLPLATAAIFFFWSGVLGALSQPLAGWLGARIGLVNTMVWTHIPASLFLMAAALVPDLHLALGLLLAPRRLVADGRARAHLLRHGRGDAGRAHRRRRLHRRAALAGSPRAGRCWPGCSSRRACPPGRSSSAAP
jgi:hypothetical protein